MSKTDFPSGPWTGFFIYPWNGRKCRTDLVLTFRSGCVTGEGGDTVGPFIIAVTYDVTTGECYWTKTYVGAHDVFYRGFRENKGIWGTWEIRSESHGGFHIWPVGNEEANEEALWEDEELPVELVTVHAQSDSHDRRPSLQAV